jgi:hypothetical protein
MTSSIPQTKALTFMFPSSTWSFWIITNLLILIPIAVATNYHLIGAASNAHVLPHSSGKQVKFTETMGLRWTAFLLEALHKNVFFAPFKLVDINCFPLYVIFICF